MRYFFVLMWMYCCFILSSLFSMKHHWASDPRYFGISLGCVAFLVAVVYVFMSVSMMSTFGGFCMYVGLVDDSMVSVFVVISV